MQKAIRKRYVLNDLLSRDQALWLCKAILTHYRSDGTKVDGERDPVTIPQRSTKSLAFKRGRNWVMHPVGYDLKERWYGTPTSGIREAWAGLRALPLSSSSTPPDEFRTYSLYGLTENHKLSIAVYRITEIVITSRDPSFADYVRQCLGRLSENIEEIPEYNPKRDALSHKEGR